MSGTRGNEAWHPGGVRLFAFHHAGGSQALYKDWRSRLPETWDLRTLDAPGHGTLFGQPHIDSLDDLAEHFLARIESELDVPYAFFGHSMGGMIAGELTHRLLTKGHTRPVWLGLSSCRAPSTRPLVVRHTLSDEELRRSVADFGGTPAIVLEDPDVWEVFGPLIRADLRLVETPRAGYSEPLTVPVTVFGGRSDASIPREHLTAWTGHCTDLRMLRLYDGGHFYFNDDPGPLLADVVRDVQAVLDTVSDPSW